MKVMENQGKPIPEILFSEGTLMVCCMGPCFLSLLWSLYLLISLQLVTHFALNTDFKTRLNIVKQLL
jgi:hypothetical protein